MKVDAKFTSDGPIPTEDLNEFVFDLVGTNVLMIGISHVTNSAGLVAIPALSLPAKMMSVAFDTYPEGKVAVGEQIIDLVGTSVLISMLSMLASNKASLLPVGENNNLVRDCRMWPAVLAK
jgi:glycerol uptake facilitator-like aquaporin